VPEQYAGTLMKCPICEKTFTVPALPPAGAGAPPPPPPPPSPIQSAPSAPPPPASFEKSSGPSAPPAGYHHTRSFALSPRLVPLVAPLSLLLVFVLLFFSWAGLYPTGTGIITQSGWDAAFGGATINPDWDLYSTKEKKWNAYFGTDVTSLKSPGISVLMLFFILVLLAALVAALASTGISLNLIPVKPPAGMETLWGYRSLLVAGLALLSFVLLALLSLAGLPLQDRVWEQAQKGVDDAKKEANLPAAEEKDPARWEIERGVRIAGMNYRTTTWFSLALFLTFVAVVGAGFTAWLDTRPNQPPPRFDILW
jgi:hypothetical protein